MYYFGIGLRAFLSMYAASNFSAWSSKMTRKLTRTPEEGRERNPPTLPVFFPFLFVSMLHHSTDVLFVVLAKMNDVPSKERM